MSTRPTNGNAKKVALITGSATGVGAATAMTLARNGWNVAINYSRSEKEAYATAEQCEGHGAETIVIKANVAMDSECRAMVAQVADKWGRMDALVNNAGITRFCDYQNLDGLEMDDFLDVYKVNVVGTYQVTRAAVPLLQLSDTACVVNTSSISAISGIGSSIAYAASKGALSTMTLSLAHALAPTIRVNGVCPGFIQGRWTKGFLGERYEAVKQGIENSTLLHRTALPSDVADSIVYLIEHANLVTGELLVIDGGQLINQKKL